MKPITVLIEDPDTGEVHALEVAHNEHIVVLGKGVHVSSRITYPNGTIQLSIKLKD